MEEDLRKEDRRGGKKRGKDLGLIHRLYSSPCSAPSCSVWLAMPMAAIRTHVGRWAYMSLVSRNGHRLTVLEFAGPTSTKPATSCRGERVGRSDAKSCLLPAMFTSKPSQSLH